MKTLLILRHAKSSWKHAELPDFDRPLNRRGKRDAPRMGELLRQLDLFPDLILSSSAQRARQTTQAVVDSSGYGGEVYWMDSLYAAPPESYLDALRALDDSLQQVMVVGHNPGMEELLEELTGEAETLPTAALAQVLLPIQSWNQLDEDVDGELVQIWRPRQLP
ncbi:MAG: histidine phosphatase family protein [Anaerolineales bacterium]